jgi:hypothetical protein
LQNAKKSIKTRYPTTDIRGDGGVVVVSFLDDMRFEVIPACENTDLSFTYFLSPVVGVKNTIALSLNRMYG